MIKVLRFVAWWISVLSCFCVMAEQTSAQIPIDTTYTVASTYRKLIKQYPHIKPVAKERGLRENEKLEVVYLTLAKTPYGRRDLHADIFIPEALRKKSFPAILLIHGGGWRAGNKGLNIPMAQALAKRGFVVVSVEYRLSLEAKYPAGVQDLTSALKWIRINANNFKIDTSRIAIAGSSAGGQLASLIGVTEGVKRFENASDGLKASRKVHAVVDMDGLLDFTNPESLAVARTENSADVFWFQGTYEKIPERWKEASALTWVDRNAPPFLFINSSQTRFHAGCADMVARLNQYGIYNEVHKLEDAPHSYWLFEPWFGPTVNYISEFLNKVFDIE
jgi:acetyl esterase/lipase